MAKHTLVNQFPATNVGWMRTVAQFLVDNCGYSIFAQSDGIDDVPPHGRILGGVVVGDLSTEGAYVELQQSPGGLSRGVLFQNISNASHYWVVRYTVSGWNSTGGGLGTYNVPDAPNDCRPFNMTSWNVDAPPPAYTNERNSMMPGDNTYTASIIGYDTAGGDTQDFYMFLWNINWSSQGFLMLARINIALADDVDPYYPMHLGVDTSYGLDSMLNLTGENEWHTGSAWFNRNNPINNGTYRSAYFAPNTTWSNGAIGNPGCGYTQDAHGRYHPSRILIGRNGDSNYPNLPKGSLKNMYWNATNFGTGTSFSTTLGPPPSRDYVVQGRLVFPWEDGTQPLCRNPV